MAPNNDKVDSITTELGKKTEQTTRNKRGTKNLILFSIEQEMLKNLQLTKFTSKGEKMFLFLLTIL